MDTGKCSLPVDEILLIADREKKQSKGGSHRGISFLVSIGKGEEFYE